MMKQGKTGVSQIAGIILILIVLVILVVSLTGLYGQTFKDSIKKIFGVQTEAEEYHETNVKSETYFENLVVDIQKCKNSQKNNCGCELDLSGFGPNHLIRTKKEQMEILDIGKIEDESIYDKDGVLLVESTDIKNMDCIFDKNLKKTDDKIHLTKNAAEKIKFLSKNENKKGLRVYVERGGCSGYTYEMQMVDDKKKGDLEFEEKGVKVFIEMESFDKLKGSYIDYLDTLQGAGFKIKNPNATSTCGCGESFG